MCIRDRFNTNEFMLNVFETMFIFSAIILINEGFKSIKKIIKEKSEKNQRENKKKEVKANNKNNAEIEAASTISYVSENKNKKKSKYLSIFSDEAKNKIKEHLLWQNINVKFFEVISFNKSSILVSMTVKTKKTPEEAESTIALIVRNISGAKKMCIRDRKNTTNETAI